MCEEFSCLPSAAIEELLDSDRLVLDIMELRAYARAKESLDNAKDEKDVPDHPMIDQVFLIQHEIMRRKREGRGEA